MAHLDCANLQDMVLILGLLGLHLADALFVFHMLVLIRQNVIFLLLTHVLTGILHQNLFRLWQLMLQIVAFSFSWCVIARGHDHLLRVLQYLYLV